MCSPLSAKGKMRGKKRVREIVHYPFGTSVLKSLYYNWGDVSESLK